MTDYKIITYIIAFVVIAGFVGMYSGYNIVGSGDVDPITENNETDAFTFLNSLTNLTTQYPIITPLLTILGLVLLFVIAKFIRGS